MKYKILTQLPGQLSEDEFGDFVAFVRAGGEVANGGLEDRILGAKWLIRLRIMSCLVGIGALKNPNANYRGRVASKSGANLPATAYSLELGWVFVLPSYRGNKFSNRITEAAVSIADGAGIFATSRSDNIAMHKALRKSGFVSRGRAYPSGRGNYLLRLFVRDSSR